MPRRSRVLVPLIMAAVALLVGGAVGVLLLWPGSLTAIVPTRTPVPNAVESSPAATPEASTPKATPSPSATPTRTATPASPAAVSAMNDCRERVQAADEVLKQARSGVQHWKAHVGAERDAAKGSISTADQQRIFKETRLQGPGDQKRYADALRAYEKVEDASCDKRKGADAKVAASLAKCQQRDRAQSRVMRTAAAAMGDWKQHLADMQRSRKVHVDNAQQVWIEAYRSAPPNINAYEKAARAFKKAPKC